MKDRPALRARVAAALGLLLLSGSAWGLVVGPNVNMVTGTRFPEGDPFLTKQNEPSVAVSSRNPRHLLAASNDYRQVAVLTAEGLGGGKAWNTLYKSVDGGTSWRSVVLGGCPLDIPACNDATGNTAALKALAPDFSADPTVRPGPHGTFFYSFIAGRRDGSTDGVVAVQRFVDKNDNIQRDTDVRQVGTQLLLKPAEDPILPDVLNILDRGTSGQFIDKPWNAADVGGRSWNAGKTCELLTWTKNQPGQVLPAAETVPAFNVYVSYAIFAGQGQNEHPTVFVAASQDCGNTFAKPVKLSNSLDANSGTSMAIDPLTGTVYVVWRRFGGLENPPKPDQIYLNKSSDGGKTWLNQPQLVTTFFPYDQAATGSSFRTLAFPAIAVSVKNGVSRVHVAFTARGAAVAPLPPYACQSSTASDCDARIKIATSADGGSTWQLKHVDNDFADPLGVLPKGRGHQVQPALAFAAGKLLVTWLDQRNDHTEEVLSCLAGSTCTQITDYRPTRVAVGNLVPTCSIDVSSDPLSALRDEFKALLGPLPGACYEYRDGRPASVWTTYLTDGTPGLVRRHTIDVFAAMADPENLTFVSNQVSQYLLGSTAQNSEGIYEIRQKEVFAPNLPLFVNGGAAFVGDYIDVAGQGIVATADPDPAAVVPPRFRYKFNVGDSTCASTECQTFTTGGSSPVFHVAFTDNRNVIPPANGDWTTRTCLATAFTGNPTAPTTNFGNCATPGFAGNRNQDVFSAIVAENSVAYSNANAKLLSASTPRGFVVTVDNLSDDPSGRTYKFQIVAPPPGVFASFDKTASLPSLEVFVQPRSSATRTVWVKAPQPNARVVVQITSPSPPGCTGGGCAYASEVALNADPGATLVGNGDGTSLDIANNDLGNVVLSNAVLTNNVLSNNALTNAALSNNALSNAALSNVVLSNAVLSNLQVENLNPATTPLDAAALSNAVLTNAMLSNVVLSNAVLTNNVLSNDALSTAVLSNNALTNIALTNIDPANVALSNAALSNNVLSNVALSNAALSNVMLSNAVLSNAALSNVVLSNVALSNNALSNNALSNNALSNAQLNDIPEALNTIEPANPDLANNAFEAADLAISDFRDVSFTVRNRGNTDTTLAVKLLLRDATNCDGSSCDLPPGVKLQLVMRKIALTPTAIPPTGPATNSANGPPRALRIGLVQSNAQVSNVGTPEIVDPATADLGTFLPGKSDAATLPLSPGERAYVTLRAIGSAGFDLAELVDFLSWGTKFVVVDANDTTTTRIPLIIKSFVLRVAAGTDDDDQLKAAGGAIVPPAPAPQLKWTVSDTLPNFEPITDYWPGGVSTDPDTGLVSVPRSVAIGSYRAYVTVKDFGGVDNVAAQSDVQRVTLHVIGMPSPIPDVSEMGIGQSIDLPATSSNGEIATIASTTPTVCRVAEPEPPTKPYYTVTGVNAGTCTVVYTLGNGTTVITDDITITRNFAVKNAQAIDFAPLASPVVYSAQSIPVNAVSKTPNVLGTATNLPVSLAVTSVPAETCLPPQATAPANVLVTGVGTCTITASQSGDTQYLAAAPVTHTLTITPASLVVSATVSPASITYGDDLKSGNVTYGYSTNGSEPACLTPLLSISVTGPAAPANAITHTITPTVSGVSASCTLTVNSATLTADKAQPVFSPLAVVGSPTSIGVSGTISRAIAGYGFVYPTQQIAIAVTGPKTLAGTTGAPSSVGVFTGAISGITPELAAGIYTVTLTSPVEGNFLSATSAAQLRIESFAATGTMKQKRASHTATLLADGGRVLVAGGIDGTGASTATSEIYCASVVPGTNCSVTTDVGQFKAIGNLPSKSAGHTATLLTSGPNAGKVLVTGGGNSSSELFNPATNTWAAGGGMSSTRAYHTATPFTLPSNPPRTLILITGGADNSGKALATTLIYDPANGTFSNGPTMTAARERHTATLLADGKRVLIHGGRVKAGNSYTVLNSAEVLIPAATVSATNFVGVPQPPPASFTVASRWGHAAALLTTGPNAGNVLVAGGASTAATIPTTLASVDLFAPSATPTGSGTWVNPSALDPLDGARRDFTVTPLLDLAGRLLAVGGRNGNIAVGTSELFDAGLFLSGPSLLARSAHAAVRLQDGRVLVTGGLDANGVATDSAQVFTSP